MLRERRQVQELPPVRLAGDRTSGAARALSGLPDGERRRVSGRGAEPSAVWATCCGRWRLSGGAATGALRSGPRAVGRSVRRRTLAGHAVEWVQQAAATLAPVEAQIKAALARAPVLHSDETGVRQAGRLAWAHVASTKQLTHYAVHAKRGAEATETIGILPSYTGVSVHDGWKPYRAHTACRHALCNIHHLRELTFLEEQYQQTWAKDLKDLLREMKAATEQARADGARHLPRRSATASSPATSSS